MKRKTLNTSQNVPNVTEKVACEYVFVPFLTNAAHSFLKPKRSFKLWLTLSNQMPKCHSTIFQTHIPYFCWCWCTFWTFSTWIFKACTTTYKQTTMFLQKQIRLTHLQFRYEFSLPFYKEFNHCTMFICFYCVKIQNTSISNGL